jgi:signal transduction histidine kinase
MTWAASPEDVALLHSVDLSVTGLQTLIDNLLESLSIEAGRFSIRRHASTLDHVIDQSVRVMRPLLDRREQVLQVDLPVALPPLWMDPMRITQVIVNLLSNASKYSPVRSPIACRSEFEDLCEQRDRIEKSIDAYSLQRRDLDELRVASPFFGL